MLFVVQFEDVYGDHSERLPERARHMPEHLAFLASHADQAMASGALRESPESQSLGGTWIVNASDKASVEAIYRQDPFWKTGRRKPVKASCWAKAFWSPAFTQRARSLGVE